MLRVLLFVLTCAAGALAIVPAARAQVVGLAWGSPDGPAVQPFTQGPVDLYVTLKGQSIPLKALDVRVEIAFDWPCFFNPDPPTDAWRFDAAGCQAGRVCMSGRAFDPGPGPAPPGYQSIADYTHNQFNEHNRALFVEAYPAPVTPDPTRTYGIARIRFDHSHSVAGDDAPPGQCANGDRGLVLFVSYASWLDAAGNENLWQLDRALVQWNREGAFVKGNTTQCNPGVENWPALDALSSSVPVCDLAVPSRMSTWGNLKALYR